MQRPTLLLILLCGATFLLGLGRPAIGDSDEAFYAEAGREMVESGDWLTPRYNYELRFQKPILFYWAVAVTYSVAGIGEAQARFWAALSGVGLSLVVLAAGRRWFDAQTGLVAGSIVATTFGYFSIGRLALPDLPLAFFVTVAIVSALAGTVDDDPRRSRWLALAGGAVGSAFLTKGPVGVIVPVLVLVPIWIVERRHVHMPRAGAVAALLVAILVGAPWYVAMALAHGRAYLDSFFVGDNFERFATSRFNDPRPLWFYLPIVLGGMLPWTPLVVVMAPIVRVASLWRQWMTPPTVRLVVWAVMPLVFFTASVGKQPRYILPLLPPLALLLAHAITDRLNRRGDGRDALVQVPAAIVGILVAAVAVVLYRARPLIVGVPPLFVAAAIGAIIVAALIVLGVAVAPRARLVPAGIAIASALTLGGLQYGLSPAGRDPVQNMATLVVRHRLGTEPIATFRVFVRNLIFYTHLPQVDLRTEQDVVDYLRSGERVLCVIGARELAHIQETSDLRIRTVGDVLFLDASAVKLRTIIDPDEERDLERVLLVTNE